MKADTNNQAKDLKNLFQRFYCFTNQNKKINFLEPTLKERMKMKIETKLTLSMIGFLCLGIISCAATEIKSVAGKPEHHTETGFKNPKGSPKRTYTWHSLWFFPSRPFAQLYESKVPAGHVIEEKKAIEEYSRLQGENTITWIGHMTALIRIDGKVILIDPWMTDHASPVPPFGPHRKMPPGITIDNLPQIDFIVVSHNHYDHFDIATLEKIKNPEKITIIFPLKMAHYIDHIPFKEVIELDWYQSTVKQKIKFTALPSVHFSARGLTDHNETLWASFAIQGLESKKKLFYFEGDYGEIYKEIGEKFGPFDVALIATGAYTPRPIMIGAHCTPAGCVQAGIDVKANILVPMHWGTVVLGTENIYETGKEFQTEAIKKGIPKDNVWILKIGETRVF